MSYFSSTVAGYPAGAVDAHYSLTMTGGAFFCSIPTGSVNWTNASGGQNGVLVQYRQQKKWQVVDDSASVVYVGRTYPVPELGMFQFTTGDFSFAFPPPGLYGSTRIDTNPFDKTAWHLNGDGSGTAAEDAMRAIVNAMHQGSLCFVQDARGRKYFGTLYNLAFDDQIDGWTVYSASFTQTGPT